MGDNYCRVFGLMARESPICVLFRRGPSKWVQLILWRTDKDLFQPGAWFHGRVYERRCDLSPDGRYLIYFAAKFSCSTLKWDQSDAGYARAWTAISRPPAFRAEILWPRDDCWHGGGLFVSNKEVWLNHRPELATPHPEHNSSLFKFTPNPEAYGEDAPIYEKRLERDGWQCLQRGQCQETGWSKWIMEPAEIWVKNGRSGKKLHRELRGIDFKKPGGPYVEAYDLVLPNGSVIRIPEAGWADLDPQGKLVFARYGKVYRGKLVGDRIAEEELIDLNANQPPTRTRKSDASN